ncbi:DUF4157 domain-containing protein [uncultured Nostoc sp.]|uniref:eCIS core domain-containing protein n=1 Tax=uncultured Nostoc sp. TaxID=340711 RepID=UPI0035CA7C73
MSDRTFGRKKAGTSTFSNPSLVSPTTPTLANPVRGFGLPTNNVIQTAIKESTNLQEVQPAGEQSLLSQAIQQRSFGHDISRIPLRRPQAKLTVGAPNDVYEQEADRIADQVMSMPDAKPSVQHEAMLEEEDEIQTKPLAATITPLVQRETMPEEEEIQTKRSPDAGFQAGSNLESQLNSSQGRGSPLPDEVRTFMEPRFGADFSQVRVHTGNESVQMNQDLNAQAFTHKQDIYFGARKAPAKDVLTAHELTHVVQQTGAVQTKEVPNKPNVQLKCSACDEEEQVQRSVEISSVSEMQVRRSWFGDDDEEKEPENSSGGGVLDWAKEKASGAVDSVSQAGGDAYDWAKDKGSAAVDTVTQAGGDAYDWAKDKGSAAVDTVTQAGGDAYNWAKDKGEQYSSELLEGKKASLLAQIGQAMQKVARQDIVYLSSDQIAALNGHLGTLSQETQGSISLPEIAAQTDSTDSTAPPGTEPIAASTVVTLLQNLQASLSTPFMSPPVSDMSDSDDSETVQSKIQRAAIAIPIVVAGGAAVSIWTILNVIGIMLFIVGIILLMSKGGKKNTADTGIMDEVRRLIEAAKKTGKLLSICEALEIIRKAAEQAGDIKKLLKLKATEKFYGCRGSSYSGR